MAVEAHVKMPVVIVGERRDRRSEIHAEIEGIGDNCGEDRGVIGADPANLEVGFDRAGFPGAAAELHPAAVFLVAGFPQQIGIVIANALGDDMQEKTPDACVGVQFANVHEPLASGRVLGAEIEDAVDEDARFGRRGVAGRIALADPGPAERTLINGCGRTEPGPEGLVFDLFEFGSGTHLVDFAVAGERGRVGLAEAPGEHVIDAEFAGTSEHEWY